MLLRKTHFKSYIDGTNLLLSPEKSIQTQRDLGADFIVVLMNVRLLMLIKIILISLC